VNLYDGTTLLGTATVDGSGNWSFTTAKLNDGTHDFTATDADVASSVFNVTIDTVAPTDIFTSNGGNNSSGSLTLTGSVLDNGIAVSGDVIKVYDGTTYLGSTTVDNNGQWSLTVAAPNNVVHSFTSTATDAAGNVGQSTGAVIYGAKAGSTLMSTAGNDIMTGGSNSASDTFVFKGSSFGNDVITDFATQGGHHDVIQFSSSVFNSFASVLAHAAQVGSDVVISVDANDSVTLSNVQLNKLASADFHFA
jgi:Bacterial Ig domain